MLMFENDAYENSNATILQAIFVKRAHWQTYYLLLNLSSKYYPLFVSGCNRNKSDVDVSGAFI